MAQRRGEGRERGAGPARGPAQRRDEVVLRLVGSGRASASSAAVVEKVSAIPCAVREDCVRCNDSRESAGGMARATLTISSKNYSSWSLRGWLLCRMAGLDFEERPVDLGDADARQELLLLSPSVLVPRLTHDGISVWDTLAIAEYLNEVAPEAGLLPADRAARAHCRSVSGEIHSGFYNLRSALPMNLKARHARSRSSPARGRTSSGSARSGTSASTPTAGRSCSARRRWPTRCTRRSAPGSAPMRSSSTRGCRRYCDAVFALAADAGMDRGGAGRGRRDRRARGGVLTRCRARVNRRLTSTPARRRSRGDGDGGRGSGRVRLFRGGAARAPRVRAAPAAGRAASSRRRRPRRRRGRTTGATGSGCASASSPAGTRRCPSTSCSSSCSSTPSSGST